MRTIEQHSYGCIPSPKDERDYKAADHVTMGVRPHEYIPKEYAPILNQGTVGSCVAHSIATMKWYQENDEYRNYDKFSTDFIYHNRLETDHQSHGMIMREAASHIVKDGICGYDKLPTNTEYPNITTRAFVESLREEAKECKTLKYVYCETLEELADCIWQYKGAILSVKVKLSFESFYLRKQKEWTLPLPKEEEKEYGYHCVCALGYTEDGVIIQNSWGDVWGYKGLAVIPWDYPISEMIAFVDERKEWDIIELYINSTVAYKNLEKITLDAPAIIRNKRTFVPIRFVAEALGAKVDWIQKTQTINIALDDKNIQLQIGNKNAYINDNIKALDVAPFISQNRTYVPIRFISESLGAQVEWIENLQKVVIRKER